MPASLSIRSVFPKLINIKIKNITGYDKIYKNNNDLKIVDHDILILTSIKK